MPAGPGSHGKTRESCFRPRISGPVGICRHVTGKPGRRAPGHACQFVRQAYPLTTGLLPELHRTPPSSRYRNQGPVRPFPVRPPRAPPSRQRGYSFCMPSGKWCQQKGRPLSRTVTLKRSGTKDDESFNQNRKIVFDWLII